MALTNPSMGYINSRFDRMQQRRGPIAAVVQLIYGVMGWLLFIPVALMLVSIVAVLPGQRLRRAAARHAAQIYLTLTAAKPRVVGLEHLPATPCIVAANHASYL